MAVQAQVDSLFEHLESSDFDRIIIQANRKLAEEGDGFDIANLYDELQAQALLVEQRVSRVRRRTLNISRPSQTAPTDAFAAVHKDKYLQTSVCTARH